jgi:diacylglycerol kinase (ATP)
MALKIIMNPFAGRWKAMETRQELLAALDRSGVEYELTLTDYPEHGKELASEAVKAGYEVIVAAGGDGTVSEVINGMIHAVGDGPLPTFGLLPMGTANDLADNLQYPKDIARAVKVLTGNHTVNLDVIQVNDRYFVNNAGLGLEPFVSIQQMKMKRLRGNVRYLVATLRAIMQNPQWEMDITWDGGSYSGPATMISVGNCARTGGIFYTVPHADPMDGKLSFVHGYLNGRLKIMKALPMIMKPAEGNISEHPAVHEIHCTWLKVRTKTPTPAHADGELFSEGLQDIEYRIHPGRVRLLFPSS